MNFGLFVLAVESDVSRLRSENIGDDVAVLVVIDFLSCIETGRCLDFLQRNNNSSTPYSKFSILYLIMIHLNKTIRADYNEQNIVVYQAFNIKISNLATKYQTFGFPSFKKERMTWIKPSFLWMMYRSGWASKKNQENILAITIKRKGFESALKSACLSTFDENVYQTYENWRDLLSRSTVRVQWDPERDILLQPLNYRCIQVGLSGSIVDEYISDWIIQIQDITEICKEIYSLVSEGKTSQAVEALPSEKEYPLPIEIANKIGISD